MIKRRISTQFFFLFVAVLLGTLALLATSTYTTLRVEKRIGEITDQTLVVTKQLHEIHQAGSELAVLVSEHILHSMLKMPPHEGPLTTLDLKSCETRIADLRAWLSQYSRYIDTYFPDETQTRDDILLISGALTSSTSAFINNVKENNAKGVAMTPTQKQQFLRNFKNLETEFLTQVDAALDYEADELRERTEALYDNLHTSQRAIWVGFGLLFALVLLVGLVMLRKIINRINALHQAATNIGALDLTSRLDESGADELSELTAHFNTMAQHLHDMNKKRDEDENKLKAFNEQLHTLVEAQTRELRTAKDRAETANTAKTTFLSAISHQLRTPLNAILGYYTQIMDIEGARTSPGDNKRHLDAIMRSSQTLLALIDEIITLSSLEKKTIPIQLGETSISQALKASIDDVDELARHKQITIVNEMDVTRLPRVIANKDHLQKVFFNLLSNAVKYNRDGGRIIIKSALLDGHNKVRITIQDTGEGFREDYPGQILEPFERLAFGNSPIEGVGVGLTIVQRFLANMEGELGYRSTVDQGSEFWVDLPSAVELVSA